MNKKNEESNVRFSTDNVLHYRQKKDVFPVEKTDWERLVGMIEKYSKISIFWWAVFSFFLSSTLELFLNLLIIDAQNFNRGLLQILTGIAATGTVFTLIAAITHRHSEGTKKKDILEEMDRMKVPLSEEIPFGEDQTEPEEPGRVGNSGIFKITKGIYGIPDHNVDVTDKLNELIKDERLATEATNALVDNDPAPGTPKFLDVEYISNGTEITKKFNENDAVDLP